MKDRLRVRFLHSLANDEVIAELDARGSDKSAVELVLSRGLGRVLLVGPLSLAEADKVRQAAKHNGAFAVLTKIVGRADPSRADIILFGPIASFNSIAQIVGDDIGEQLSATLAAFNTPPQRILNCRDRQLSLGQRTLIMGIINATPDSFSGDGLGLDAKAAITQAKQMVEEGADLLDIGGESTRPGSEPVPAQEELRRIIPVIEHLTSELSIPISVDTYKAPVAKVAFAAGAHIVNDISGLHYDNEMAQVAAEAGAAVCIMHIKGTPRDMQKDPKYVDVIGEISDYLEEGISFALTAGIPRDRLILDPGIGFGKTLQHNLVILRHLREFRSLGFPLLVGASRKSMLGALLGGLPPEQRIEGTAATVTAVITGGADIVRVHDVKEISRVVKVADAICRVTHELHESEHAWADRP